MTRARRRTGQPGHRALLDQYARAREALVDWYADEIVRLAIEDAGSDDDNPVRVNRSRLRVDTLKWLMSKLHPKKYGDKVELEHGGKIGLDDFVGMTTGTI